MQCAKCREVVKTGTEHYPHLGHVPCTIQPEGTYNAYLMSRKDK